MKSKEEEGEGEGRGGVGWHFQKKKGRQKEGKENAARWRGWNMKRQRQQKSSAEAAGEKKEKRRGGGVCVAPDRWRRSPGGFLIYCRDGVFFFVFFLIGAGELEVEDTQFSCRGSALLNTASGGSPQTSINTQRRCRGSATHTPHNHLPIMGRIALPVSWF